MGRVRGAAGTVFGGWPGVPPNLGNFSGRAVSLAARAGATVAAAWLLAGLPAPWIGAALGVCAGTLILMRFPWLVWPGLAVVLPFASGFRAGPLSVVDAALAGAICLWFVDGVRRDRLRLSPGPLPWLLAIYLLALLLSFSNAVDLREALEGVIKWAQMLVAVLLIRETLPPRRARWLVWGLLAGGALQAVTGLYQFLFQVGPANFVLFDRFMRAYGSFGQPNPYAGYLGLTFPVALALFLDRLFASLGSGATVRWRVAAGAAAYGCLTGVIGVGLVASWSRGGWLGATAGAAVVLSFLGGRKLVGAALGAGALLLLAGRALQRFVPAAISARLEEIPAYLGLGIREVVQQPVTDSNFSVIERLAHWIAAVRMWELSPWFGIGPGNYAAVYPRVSLPRWEEPLGHAHNVYLNVLAENGLVGLFAYLTMWAGIVLWLARAQRGRTGEGEDAPGLLSAAHSARRERETFQRWNRTVIVGIIGVAAHLTVHQLFDFLYVRGIYLHVALWLGAALVLARDAAPPGRGRQERKRGVPAGKLPARPAGPEATWRPH